MWIFAQVQALRLRTVDRCGLFQVTARGTVGPSEMPRGVSSILAMDAPGEFPIIFFGCTICFAPSHDGNSFASCEVPDE